MEVCVKRASLIAAFCVLFLPVVGLADTLTFSGTNGGEVSVGGLTSGTAATVTDFSLPISMVTGSNGVSNPGGYSLTNGLMSFSGTIQGPPSSFAVSGVIAVYTVTLTSFEITGGNGLMGITNGSPILTASSGTLTITDTSAGAWSISVGSAPATLNGNMATFFNTVTSGNYSGSTGVYTGADCTSGGCSYPVFIDPTGSTTTYQVGPAPPPVQNNVPEPLTVSLLGAGLIGLFGLGRRRS